jgi:hypothetical protein
VTQMPPGDSPLADVLKDLQDDLEMALERVRCLRAGSAGGAEPAKGWPKRMEQKPDQAPSYRGYVNGWNECLSDCERALAAPPAAPDGERIQEAAQRVIERYRYPDEGDDGSELCMAINRLDAALRSASPQSQESK